MNTDKHGWERKRERAWEALYKEMGVFFKGCCEHAYRFKEWKGAGGELSAFSRPLSRFRFFPRLRIIQAAPAVAGN